MTRWAWVLGLIASIATPSLSAPPGADRDELSPRSRASSFELEADDGLDLRIELRLPSWSEGAAPSLLSQLSLSPRIPGQLGVRYRGLQGFVVKRLTSRYRKLFTSQIGRLAPYLTDAELRARYQEMGDAIADMEAGGRWWERAWYYSLSPEAGGAPPPTIEEVGERVEVLRLGPLTVTNDLRARLHLLELGVGSGCVVRDIKDTQVPLRDHARLLREQGDLDLSGEPDQPAGPTPQDDVPPLAARLALPPTHAEYEGVRFELKLRPELNARLDSSFLPDTRVGLRVVLDVRLGAKETLVSRIEARVSYRQTTGELAATLQVALVSW
ncbi:MAG: hypothetical protein AB7N76_26385 [Planctomycetota bacterium]